MFNRRYFTTREDEISVILDNRFSDNFQDIYNGSDVSFFVEAKYCPWKHGTVTAHSFQRVFLCRNIPAVILGIILLELTERTRPSQGTPGDLGDGNEGAGGETGENLGDDDDIMSQSMLCQ